MDMPLLKLAEVGIVVVAGLAFYVWQMRQLKRDRAQTAAEEAARRQALDAPHDTTQGKTAQATPRPDGGLS
jgi:hypothetical protein